MCYCVSQRRLHSSLSCVVIIYYLKGYSFLHYDKLNLSPFPNTSKWYAAWTWILELQSAAANHLIFFLLLKWARLLQRRHTQTCSKHMYIINYTIASARALRVKFCLTHGTNSTQTHFWIGAFRIVSFFTSRSTCFFSIVSGFGVYSCTLVTTESYFFLEKTGRTKLNYYVTWIRKKLLLYGPSSNTVDIIICEEFW